MSNADYIQRARDAVDAALMHHDDAVDAYGRDDPMAVKEAHARLRRSLKSAKAALGGWTDTGDQKVNGTTSTIQTSNGVDESGGSANGRANGRAGSPLLRGNAGLQNFLDRARAGSRR